ncbi:NAD(P)H-hydrate dehydratase [Dechloromonas sp. HYN0024]|uniref:NAD(P)H-hydrate dehydratase n=1 Tax=Dechloromonas sp. HYN0024 TaxID=2231055 RepID=UPI000E43B2B1|nr:NAD(P)H-hydrate dehydratase [Dechloromonas sp. HYN0024]AXS79706.1 NAD(P)H-hydrate dehydratase [Dechloromonas sp. HYN0024]
MNPNPLYLTSSLRRLEAAHAAEDLMERAGAATADWAATLASVQSRPILILAGPGNNGGDAFVAARLLRQRFFDVRVVFMADPGKLPADAAAAYRHFIDAGGRTVGSIPDDTHWSLIIDGLFGIGLTRAPDGNYAQWIATANHLARRDNCPLLALDCPSGLNADTGTCFAPCIQASHTITFIAGKPGLLTADGPDCCGEIQITGLELTPVDELPADGYIVSLTDFAIRLKTRTRNTHKGSFGSAGILGGARSMVGAALLAGRAALKLGAGRVYLGLLDAEGPSVDLGAPELMIRSAETLLGTDLQALACGPGLGCSAAAQGLLEQSLKTSLPLVLDADALNLLAADRRLESQLVQRDAPAIMTPHPAEAARLLSCSVGDIQSDRIQAARHLASRYHCNIALKGCGTVIASTDGRFWINSSGNPGMATAGMGDVLSGLVTALLAQNWPPEMALLAGVHLHGAAADRLVGQGIGPVGLTASEVVDAARHLFNDWVIGQRSL